MNFFLTPKLYVSAGTEDALPEQNEASVPAEGEHLIPYFPMGGVNASAQTFISAETGRQCDSAVVMQMTLEDPEEIVELFHKQFPGLPVNLLNEYVGNVAVKTHYMKIGDIYRVFVSGYTATVQNVVTENTVVLWENLSTEQYL